MASENIVTDVSLDGTVRKKIVLGDHGSINNVMRHRYKVLSDSEKENMANVKDVGLAFHDLVGSLGASREISLAKTKIEEAVMWAVKHITG